MKEYPLLFTAPMVRAILEGRKTQTRRIVKPHRKDGGGIVVFPSHGGGLIPVLCKPNGELWDPIMCPFGQPGDRLWVREAWRLWSAVFDGEADIMRGRIDPPEDPEHAAMLQRRVEYREGSDDAGSTSAIDGWRPSIHMPRWASRITLEITGIRVERLTSISEVDAKAEGLKAITKDGSLVKYGIPDRDGLPGTDDDGWPWHRWDKDPRVAFLRLWESVYGPESVMVNPWVWVVEFRRVEAKS